MSASTLYRTCALMLIVGTVVISSIVLLGEWSRASDARYAANPPAYEDQTEGSETVSAAGTLAGPNAPNGATAPDAEVREAAQRPNGEDDHPEQVHIAGNHDDHSNAAPVQEALPASFIIGDVPALSQFPLFYNGCELVSTTMLLQYKGWAYGADELEPLLPKDPTPLVRAPDGDIVQWGDPSIGFVGDITGKKQMGYSVNHEPIIEMLTHILGDEADRIVNLTGTDVERLKAEIAAGHPVVVWNTIQSQPTSAWMSWKSAEGKEIKATFQVHAVLLVGYDETHFYINDPYTGGAYERVAQKPFLESWSQMNNQALTIR